MVFGFIPLWLFVALISSPAALIAFGVFALASNNWLGGCIGAIVVGILAAIVAYMIAMVIIALPTPPINPPPPGVTPGPNPTQVSRPATPGPVAPVDPTVEPAPLAPPPPANNVGPVPANSTVKSGMLVVERSVDHAAKTIDVRAKTLSADTTYGKFGLKALDGWQGYGSVSYANMAACEQAKADLDGSRTQGAWNQGYKVTLNGNAVPSVCN